jgi:hypothetical protein
LCSAVVEHRLGESFLSGSLVFQDALWFIYGYMNLLVFIAFFVWQFSVVEVSVVDGLGGREAFFVLPGWTPFVHGPPVLFMKHC